MGFNKVYKSLQEIFPQIDARALRAVAIEHSKDADAAVEAVCLEIIPFFTERSRPSSPSMKSDSVGASSSKSATAAQTVDPSAKQLSFTEVENGYKNGGSKLPNHDAGEGHREPFTPYEGESSTAGLTLPVKIHENNTKVGRDFYTQVEPVVSVVENRVNPLQIETSGVLETVEITADKQPESSITNIPWHAVATSQNVRIEEDQHIDIIHEKEDNYSHVVTDFGVANDLEKYEGNSCPDVKSSAHVPASVIIDNHTDTSSENVGQSVELKPVEESSTYAASMMESSSGVVVIDDNSSLEPPLSQSSQMNIIEVLQEIIEEARNHKKTLSAAKESVISLMKEVELKELGAKQAEEEADKGDADIWVKVEELKQMLQHAKEANDMHSGEVYGEKAVLGTELRELQSRVLSMSDERDKNLSVLDEMRRTLEERLSAAQNKITSAEHKKQKMVQSAREALAEQELIMEKVVQESNILKQQAEENAKLREFLMERGRAVDMLQGEIAVICQDIRVLKEKYDENVPFSNSLFSSHSSSFLGSSHSSLRSMTNNAAELSSSTPSVRSMTEDQVEPAVLQDETQKKIEPTAGVDEQVPLGNTQDERNALIEDGWDFFENGEVDS